MHLLRLLLNHSGRGSCLTLSLDVLGLSLRLGKMLLLSLSSCSSTLLLLLLSSRSLPLLLIRVDINLNLLLLLLTTWPNSWVECLISILHLFLLDSLNSLFVRNGRLISVFRSFHDNRSNWAVLSFAGSLYRLILNVLRHWFLSDYLWLILHGFLLNNSIICRNLSLSQLSLLWRTLSLHWNNGLLLI